MTIEIILWSISTKVMWPSCNSNIQPLDLQTGPSCSKLTTSLVNDSLKFTSSDTQICWNFCWKNVSSFCSAKATHIFSAKNIRILCIEPAKTVNEMTLNELVKLTTLWTTGPRCAVDCALELGNRRRMILNMLIIFLKHVYIIQYTCIFVLYKVLVTAASKVHVACGCVLYMYMSVSCPYVLTLKEPSKILTDGILKLI